MQTFTVKFLCDTRQDFRLRISASRNDPGAISLEDVCNARCTNVIFVIGVALAFLFQVKLKQQ